MITKCEICNIAFETINPNQKYCSPKCSTQGQKMNNAVRYAHARSIVSTRKCPVCGKKFKANRNGARTKYCSEECFKEYRRINNRDRWRAANPEWDKGTSKACKYCGEEFVDKSRAKIARFCSDECRDRSKGHKPWEEHLEELEQQRQERLESSRQNMVKNWPVQDWEYIRGYTEGNSDIQMKCLHCNKVTTVKIDDIVGRKTWECTPECIEEVEFKQEQERSLKKKQRKKEEWEALPVKQCVICDREYKTWQPSQVTCSKKCSNQYNKQMKRERGRLRKYDIKIIDHNITLDDLYKRDNGTCHLCNGQCDWDDYSRRDGAFIVGPSHPSIDHLVPRSKGGVHSWDNIKLAHHYCNTIKNNNEEVEDTSTEYQRIMAL